MTRIAVVEHQESCPPALVGDWLLAAGCELEIARPYLGEALPDLDRCDALLVLGGEMSANDDESVPWLGPLKQQLRVAVGRALPLWGICLGHQLIATALGGVVTKNPHGQRVGLQRVGWEPDARDDPLFGATTEPVRAIHWNGDVVEAPPAGTQLLASGPGADLQAARFAPAAWGVQAHPEADIGVVRRWAESDRAEHLARGIDQEAALAAIEAARGELELSWRPVAERFADLAARHAARTSSTRDDGRDDCRNGRRDLS